MIKMHTALEQFNILCLSDCVWLGRWPFEIILQHTTAEDPVPDVHVSAWRDMEKIEAEEVMLLMRGGAKKNTELFCRANSAAGWCSLSWAWRADTHVHALMHSNSQQIDIIVTTAAAAPNVCRKVTICSSDSEKSFLVSEKKQREKSFLVLKVCRACCLRFWKFCRIIF